MFSGATKLNRLHMQCETFSTRMFLKEYHELLRASDVIRAACASAEPDVVDMSGPDDDKKVLLCDMVLLVGEALYDEDSDSSADE